MVNQFVLVSVLMGLEGMVVFLNLLSVVGVVGVDYCIVFNDLMEFNVFGVFDMKCDVCVNVLGQVLLLFIGLVQVVGFILQVVEELIVIKYWEKYLCDLQVLFFIKEFIMQCVVIEGVVIKLGIYLVMGQFMLLCVLVLFGGFVQYVNINQIMVYCNG